LNLLLRDGIGTEVIDAALIVLRRIARGRAIPRGAPICGDDHEIAWCDDRQQ
jgi:isocitrate/isopropylmalate dehydrogenase